MSKKGINYPEVIDLVAENDTEVILIIVQTELLTDALFINFQEKVNNYISFAKDGQMIALYPNVPEKDIVIRIDMYEIIETTTLELFLKTKDALLQHNIKFIWSKCAY